MLWTMTLFTTLRNFMSFGSEVFEIQASEVWRFSHILMAKWPGGHTCTPTKLPPYKPQEILQSFEWS